MCCTCVLLFFDKLSQRHVQLMLWIIERINPGSVGMLVDMLNIDGDPTQRYILHNR